MNQASIEVFKAGLQGQLIQPGDENYDDACKVYNAMIKRHPRLIIHCADATDVMDSVNFARENNLLVSVRGGGHSGPGLGTCDGGMVIDLSPIKYTRVDTLRTYCTGWRWEYMERCGPCHPCLRFSNAQWGRVDNGSWWPDLGRRAWVPNTQIRTHD